jgi:hypothetical protein
MADECRRVLVGRRVGDELDPVLRREVVELVGRPTRVDEVRGKKRVLGGLDVLRLRVVGDERALEPRRPRADDNAFRRRDRDPAVLGGDAA